MKINGRQSIEIKDLSAFNQFLSQYNLSISPEIVKKVQLSLAALFSRNTYMQLEIGGERDNVTSEKVDTFLRRAMDILETTPQEHLGGISYRDTQNKFSTYESKPYLEGQETIQPITQDELNSTLEEIIKKNAAEKNQLNDLVVQMSNHDFS